MTVRFILGRAGSGKTTYCLEAIARLSQTEPVGPPIIFLAPEQATFQMERDLAIRCGGGTFRAQVLSFQRLAYQLLQMRGGHLPIMSELGRQLALRRILQQQEPGLETFRRAAKQPRFCEQLAVQVRELKNYRVEPCALQQFVAEPQCPPPLRGKLADLSVIYAAYTTFTAGRFTDPEDTLSLLAAQLAGGVLPAGTQVWVDSFAGLTEQEYQVIAALFKQAAHVEIALCLDPQNIPESLGEAELFHPTLDTYLRLRQLCGVAGTKAYPPLHLPVKQKDTRFSANPALCHLEQSLHQLPVKTWQEDVHGVRLVTTAGTRAEVEAVARDILHQVREKGWRFREIGIVLRDFDRYHDLVAAIFADFNIPCFIDNRRTAAHHPLVELLRSALEAALSNLHGGAVLQMLKTDLFPITRLAADRMENYVRAHGIRGSRWIDGQPWAYRLHLSLDETRDSTTPEDESLAEINNSKDLFAAHFKLFYTAVSPNGKQDARQYCTASWDFLKLLNVQQTLQAWTDADLAAGMMDRAGEHRQVWQGIIELLDQTVEIIGDHRLSLQEFYQIMLAGLESLTLGIIPAGLDQVVVGSVERSRQPNLQAAYVLGLSEGDFPARLGEDGLFADEERTTLTTGGINLAPTRRQRLFHEQYLAYIALTRSSQYLWISCPLADEEGKAKRPSSLFAHLREIFPGVEVAFVGNTAEADGDLHALAGRDHCAATLLLQAGSLKAQGELAPFWATVYNEALQVPEIAARMQSLWPALQYHNTVFPLSADNIGVLLGTPLRSSVSRMELFARCPFAHLARYGLRLEARQEFKLEAPDMGTFYHAALRLFVEQLMTEGIDWSTLASAEAQARMGKIVDKLVPRLHGEILLSSARMRYLAEMLKETLAVTVAGLTEHAHRSRFQSVAVEASFGTGKLPAWELELEDGQLLLYGQIDRVDLAETEDQAYLRVIDYKSNPMELKLADVWHGLSLQLLSYLAVVGENAKQYTAKKITCAGAFYFGIQQPYNRLDNPPVTPPTTSIRLDGLMLEDADVFHLMGGSPELVRASLKQDGSFSKASRVADEKSMAALMEVSKGKLKDMAAAILAGASEIAPFKKHNGQRACAFCDYMALCCFDPVVAGNGYRYLPGMTNSEVLQQALLRTGGVPDGQGVD